MKPPLLARCAVVLACLVPALFSCTGADVPVPDPDTASMQRRVGDAIRVARARVVSSPSAETWGHFADLCYAHKLYDEAEISYGAAAGLEPDEFRWAYMQAGAIEMKGGDGAEILARYEDAAEMAPDFPPVHFRIGEALARQGQAAEACAAFERALELDPDLAIAHRALAQALLQEGDTARAAMHFERADGIRPGDQAVLSGMAQAYTRLGRTDEAREAAEASRDAPTLLALPDEYRFQVREKALSSEICLERGRERLEGGNPAGALTDFRIVEDLRPEDPSIHNLIGRAYLGMREFEEAEKSLRHALELDPNYAPAHFALGEYLAQVHEPADGLPNLRKAAELEPDRSRYLAQLAFHLVRHGDLDQAVHFFDRAARVGELETAQWHTWGNVLLKQGQFVPAREKYARVVELDPANVNAHFSLGLLETRLGNPERAAEHYRTILTEQPNHAARNKLAELGFSE